MPEFVNPFTGMVPREMTDTELARAIMLNISAEYEAVHLYLAHMDATSNEDARKVLYDIALEELVHVGEFTSLLFRLDPIAGAKTQEGFAEVQELLARKSPYNVEPSSDQPENASQQSGPSGFTVGGLKHSFEQGEQ